MICLAKLVLLDETVGSSHRGAAAATDQQAFMSFETRGTRPIPEWRFIRQENSVNMYKPSVLCIFVVVLRMLRRNCWKL